MHSNIILDIIPSFTFFSVKIQNKQRLINYAEFSQFLHDFHEEYARDAFVTKDPSGTGYISPLDFQDIMVKVKRHLLTSEVRDNLVAVRITISFRFYGRMIISYVDEYN